ncbi:MAG: hypothetical protein QOH52_2590, partial [Pseudonocardiales bacterium]|nr:hypothetical protein [Pseudonocardiales bacterium]
MTPTVAMLSPERWLLSLTLDIPDFLNLRRWLSPPAMVPFDCGVAPMWPEPVREQCTEPSGHDDSQAPASAMRSRRPSTVLEMFWSTEPTWISVLVGATQLQTFLLGRLHHDGGSQREISVDKRVSLSATPPRIWIARGWIR